MNTETIERPVAQILEILPTKTTALAAVEMQAVALARFGDWRAGAAALVKKFAAVAFDCTTTRGMREAEDARAEVRAPRYLAQNVSKNSKTELAAISRAVGAEEKAIIDALAETEAHIEGQISAELARKAAIKAEAARVEVGRKAAHQAGIALIGGFVTIAIGKTSAQILRGIAHLEDADMTGWEEFTAAASVAQADAITTLRTMATAALDAENAVIEMARVRAEQARIAEEQQAEGERLAAEAAEQKRIAAEAKRVADAAAKVEADKLAGERAEFSQAQQAAEALIAQQQAEIDTQRIALGAASKPAAAPVVELVAEVAEDAPDITTGEICARLKFVVNSALIESFGFERVTGDYKGSRWTEANFRPICAALVAHIRGVAA